ncbi:hypothetical protein B0H14DRAFT_3581699 [Mycena olivaceomarginata]|nr:hypothetical protein B0H14DRAFT_3581699 [Mycena olivaceomarginata]
MVENPNINPWCHQQNGLNPCPHGTPQFFPDGFRPPPWNAPWPSNPDYLTQWAPGYPPQTPYTSGFNRNAGMGPFGLDDDDFPRPWPGRWDAPLVLADRFQALHTVLVLLAVLALQAMAPPSFPGPMQMAPFPSSPFPNMPMVLFPSSPFPAMPMTPMPMAPMTPMTPMPMTPSGQQPILFTRKEASCDCDCEHLAARPGNWRTTTTPRGASGFPLCAARAAIEASPPLEHCHLSPMLLMPSSKTPVLAFDLRADHPFDPVNLELLATRGRPFNPTDLAQLATARPVAQLRFYHPRLPWYADLHAALHRPIRAHDFSNKALSAADRERVDFMGPDVILQGFVGGKNGMWLMKTTRYGCGG